MEPPDPDYTLRGFDGPVTCLTFANGQPEKYSDLLLAGTQDGSLYCWDLQRRRVVYQNKDAHSGAVLYATVLIGSREVLTQGREGIVHRWHMEGDKVGHKIRSYPSADLGFCPTTVFSIDDRPVMATTSSQLSTIAVIALDSGETIATLVPQEKVGMVMDMKAAVDGTLFAGYEDGSIAVWDVRKVDTPTNRVQLHDEAVASLDYCNFTRRGMSAGVDGSLVMWDGCTLTAMASTSVDLGVACVKARQDGKLFAVGCCNNCIKMYSGRRKMTPLVSAHAHTQTVQCLTFHSSDKRLAAGSRDKTVSIWSLYRD